MYRRMNNHCVRIAFNIFWTDSIGSAGNSNIVNGIVSYKCTRISVENCYERSFVRINLFRIRRRWRIISNTCRNHSIVNIRKHYSFVYETSWFHDICKWDVYSDNASKIILVIPYISKEIQAISI